MNSGAPSMIDTERLLERWCSAKYRHVMLPGAGAITCGEFADAIFALRHSQGEAGEVVATECALAVEEAHQIAVRVRQIVQDVWDKREGYSAKQAWADLHGQAMMLLEWDIHAQRMTASPQPNDTPSERTKA